MARERNRGKETKMGLTTTDAKIPHGATQHPLPGEHTCREALEHALVELQQWENYEHAKEEEWFEVDDPEMYAYHRGYERGIERSLSIVEAALNGAEDEEAPEKAGQEAETPSQMNA